ncbi:hypothetical protein MMPV_003167 [Pyropia vietnamensis]
MRWRLSPLRLRRLRQLLSFPRLTGYRRLIAAAATLLLLTIVVLGRGLNTSGGLPAWGPGASTTPWGHYIVALRPTSGGQGDVGGEDAGKAGQGEGEPPNMAGVTVETNGAGAKGEELGGATARRGGGAVEAGGAATRGGGSTVPTPATDGATDRTAASGGTLASETGLSGTEAAAPNGASRTEAATEVVGVVEADVPTRADPSGVPGGASGAGAPEQATADMSTQPLEVQPGTLFDRIYIITDLACTGRHDWINAMAAAAGVQSPIEMFPLVANASDVDLQDPPLPVVDVDPAKSPTVTAADVVLTATHRALWRRVFDDQYARVLVLSDTWFPSRSLWQLLPELLKAVEAGASPDRAWHLLLLTRRVASDGHPEVAWTNEDASAALNRTVTVVPVGAASAADRAYILSAAGVNMLLSRLTAHRTAIGTAMVNLPDVTTLSGCDNAHFLQECPENGASAPSEVVDTCATRGAELPAAAFPNLAEAQRVAVPMVVRAKDGSGKARR